MVNGYVEQKTQLTINRLKGEKKWKYQKDG